jgi:DNA-binding transcriptional MocR family regulator
MTYIKDGTEYLDSQEMKVYEAVRANSAAGRTTNTSQVAADVQLSRTTVSNVLAHLKARGFIKDISHSAAYKWRLTDKPALPRGWSDEHGGRDLAACAHMPDYHTAYEAADKIANHPLATAWKDQSSGRDSVQEQRDNLLTVVRNLLTEEQLSLPIPALGGKTARQVIDE